MTISHVALDDAFDDVPVGATILQAERLTSDELVAS